VRNENEERRQIAQLCIVNSCHYGCSSLQTHHAADHFATCRVQKEFRRGSSALADASALYIGSKREKEVGVARCEIDGERKKLFISFVGSFLCAAACSRQPHFLIPLIHSRSRGRSAGMRTLIASGSSIKLPLRKGNGIRRTLAYTRLYSYICSFLAEAFLYPFECLCPFYS
jgi:hypothetical protein